MLEKIAIITPANLPIPAVKGGAVESLLDDLCDENEKNQKLDINIFSIYDRKLNKKSPKKYTTYDYVYIPAIIRLLDHVIYFLFKKMLDKDDSPSFRYLLQHIYYIIVVAFKIKSFNYDKIIVENYAMMLWCIKLFGNSKKYENKYYYHMHNVITHFFGCKRTFEKCNKILGVSNYILNTLPREVQNASNCVVLRNGIKVSEFNKILSDKEANCLRKKYQIGKKKIVLFVGRFVPEKGVEELLEAWKKLNRSDSILLIVGGAFFKSDIRSDFERKMIRLAKSMNNSVKFTGYIDYKEMPKFYALADLIVIPSIWDDPAPLTILESLAAKKPLIATNSGGIPEYLNGNGIIIKRNSHMIENLSRNISSVLSKKIQVPIKKVENIDVKDYYAGFLKIIK